MNEVNKLINKIKDKELKKEEDERKKKQEENSDD
ncbi:hypothetical protein MSCUN_06820 [Methanosphaera cuniculi]|uniref:Uncharacterized protein n=1 Tax=Methanosphaera cuniculi TaxID=1077256 RepID=A0A2V2BKG3_9EURY|nr:hypothetical protein MSCUN_06820 [Methanosphaera cuniculi]